jgi:hypothetical protein
MNGLGSARGKGLSFEEFFKLQSVAEELNARWGDSNPLVQDLLRGLLEHEGGKPQGNR